MIEISNLTVQFGGVKGLNDVNVRIETPVTGLIGPNGAGKTTMLNVFSGFVKPFTGRILLEGRDLLSLPAHRRSGAGVRRTFQTEQTVETLSVWDNVAAALDHQPGGSRDRRKAIGAVLDYVGLDAGHDRLGADLNACERRLLEIARCLVGRPLLLMMDEPGAGLAVVESAHLRRVIAGVPDFCGARVLLVDHDVELISAVCQSTIVLDFGQKIAFGPTAEVLADRRVRAAYLGVVDGEAA
jgi:ABC-type branched-subunit amino acid transport system ATPase component